MAHRKDTSELGDMLFRSMGTEDPMLNMLEWLCSQMMEAEGTGRIGAHKQGQNEERTSRRCGFRPRRLGAPRKPGYKGIHFERVVFPCRTRDSMCLHRAQTWE